MEGLIIKNCGAADSSGRCVVEYARAGKNYTASVAAPRAADPQRLRNAVAEAEAQRSGEEWLSPETWLTQQALSALIGLSRWQVPEYARKGWLRRQAPPSGNTGFLYAVHDWALISELKASTRVDLLRRQATVSGALGVEAETRQLDLTRSAAAPQRAAEEQQRPLVSPRAADVIRLFREQQRPEITPSLADRLVVAADEVGFTPRRALAWIEEKLSDFSARPKRYEIGALVAFIEQDIRSVARAAAAPKSGAAEEQPQQPVKAPSHSWTAIRAVFGMIRDGQDKIARVEPREVVNYTDERRATYRVTSALYTPLGARSATTSVYDVGVKLEDGATRASEREIARAYLYRCAYERARNSVDFPAGDEEQAGIRKLILRLVDEWQG